MLSPAELQLAVEAAAAVEAAQAKLNELYDAAKEAQNGTAEGRADRVKTLTNQADTLGRDLEALYS